MVLDPYKDTNPRKGGVWKRPRKYKVFLKYCLGKDCTLMSLGSVGYWMPCDVEAAHKKGYDTIMAFCPAHQVLPTDSLVSA